MKHIIMTLTMFLSLIFTQDRSLIFNTGAPLGSCFPSNSQCNSVSDCLITGFYTENESVVLAVPEREIQNGSLLS